MIFPVLVTVAILLLELENFTVLAFALTAGEPFTVRVVLFPLDSVTFDLFTVRVRFSTFTVQIAFLPDRKVTVTFAVPAFTPVIL